MGVLNSTQIQMLERRKKIELMVLRGAGQVSNIAATFGMAESEVRWVLSEIKRVWKEEKDEELLEARALREKQLEHLYFLSLQSFERSKVGPKEITKEKKVCTWCGGLGRDEVKPGNWQECKECKGSGDVEFESSANRLLPGDGNYLRLAKDIVVEMMKLDGCYPEKTPLPSRSLMMTVEGSDAGMKAKITEMYLDQADPEVVMRAMRVIDDLEATQPVKVIEHRQKEKSDE